jgi:hypothetical protein
VREFDLSAAEQRVWKAFPARSLVDLRGESADRADLASAAGWDADRTVRGEVIAALLLGSAAAEPGRVPGVRLAGARIAGVIDVSDGDVAATPPSSTSSRRTPSPRRRSPGSRSSSSRPAGSSPPPSPPASSGRCGGKVNEPLT